MEQTCIKNIRPHFEFPYKILLNYKILAVLSNFGTSIAIRKGNGVRNTERRVNEISADGRLIYMKK